MSAVDMIQAEIAGLEQGMLQLRLQQQEADAHLRQISDAMQQQAGALATLQRVAARLQQAEEKPAAHST